MTRVSGVIDTGAHMFVGGACYYRQIDHLSLMLCVAKVISDEHWEEYIAAGYDLAQKQGAAPRVSMAAFTDAFPSASQRARLADYLKSKRVPPLERVAILTDNALLRGAMTAFGWIMPRTTLRSFSVSDVPACLAWLQGGAKFDEARATAAWTEARMKLGVMPR